MVANPDAVPPQASPGAHGAPTRTRGHWWSRLSAGPPSRFAGMARGRARLLLLLFVLLSGWGWYDSLTLPSWPLGGRAFVDEDLYRTIIERVHQGEGYYDALGNQFHRDGYQSASTFNWRQPTYAYLLGALPDHTLGFWLLLLLSLLSIVTVTQTLLKPVCGTTGTLVGVLFLMSGTFSWCIYEPQAYLSTEPWCAALLLLSLSAYARGWWPAGMAAALAALALRELVLPYCLVAVGLAWWQGRRSELLVWMAALSMYVGLYAWHCHAIRAQSPETAVASGSNWLAWNGLRFVLKSSAMNVLVRPLPPWGLALYLPLALLGLAGWRGDDGRRLLLSVLVYLLPFLCVRGNDYWGCLFTPMLMLGLLTAPAALRDLLRAAFPPKAPGVGMLAAAAHIC